MHKASFRLEKKQTKNQTKKTQTKNQIKLKTNKKLNHQNKKKIPKPKKTQKQTNNFSQNTELSFTSEYCKNNIDLGAQAFT